MAAIDAFAKTDLREKTLRNFARKRAIAFAMPAVIPVYFAYIFVAFDIPGLAQRAKMDNAVILLSDAISYKVHVTQDNRRNDMTVSVEGSRRASFTDDQILDWIARDGARVTITLSGGHVVTRSRVDTFRYFYGWELFFFDTQSRFYGLTGSEVLGAAFGGPQVHPELPNWQAVVRDVKYNSIWRHGDVVWAIGETALMAFLGTIGAAALALPLAFMTAQNFTPAQSIRFAVRRLCDFVRRVDAMIFTIILSRAFGPGPVTGARAILIKDSGTFGKLFSEALENTDKKQVEGLQSTGANAMQRFRFGVIPQVMPVLLSQILYFREFNTRSATIIGAIVGGGIGLMLTQAIQTTQDWGKVTY
ncbi:MAG: PhnE/PtxC family ABC transporter permease [Roseinatronobacter sp.]